MVVLVAFVVAVAVPPAPPVALLELPPAPPRAEANCSAESVPAPVRFMYAEAAPPAAPAAVPVPAPPVPPVALTDPFSVVAVVSVTVSLDVPLPPWPAVPLALPPPAPPIADCVRFRVPLGTLPLAALVRLLLAPAPPLARRAARPRHT